MDPGTLVDAKYQIVRQLGQGGMGAVYEARHVGTSRRVALKVIIREALIAGDKEIVARFQREARASGAIDSQHVVQVLDTGVDPQSGSPYLVMEYLAGEDLHHVIQRIGPLAPDLALRVIAQACAGLARAHDEGIVHRDIKAANLYLAPVEHSSIGVTFIRLAPGTPQPQVTGEGYADAFRYGLAWSEDPRSFRGTIFDPAGGQSYFTRVEDGGDTVSSVTGIPADFKQPKSVAIAGSELWALGQDTGGNAMLVAINVGTGTVTRSTHASQYTSPLAWGPDGGLLSVIRQDGGPVWPQHVGSVDIANGDTLIPIGEFISTEPTGLAYDPTHDRIFFTSGGVVPLLVILPYSQR